MSRRSKGTREHTVGAPTRGAGVIAERDHDAYRADHKMADPARCPQCGAAYLAGRWQWATVPADAKPTQCPACQRIHDDLPAGYVTIEGEYFAEHRDELMRLIDNRAEAVKAAHPLQRIIAVRDTDAGVQITTTDMHLARGIAEALQHAHKGELSLRYEDAQTLLRAHWRR